MDQIELFNYLLYLKPFILNRITSVKGQYLKQFNSVQTNELWLVLKNCYLKTIPS